MPTFAQVIVWVIIGLIGGASRASSSRGGARDFGLLRNFAMGLIGAVVGGVLFRIFEPFSQTPRS